jgi:hypothetical protein
MFELRGYIDENGNRRFAAWLEELDSAAAAKVTIALTRMRARKLLERQGRRRRPL